MLDLGDLTSQKELEIVCPNNRLGKIDFTSRHTMGSTRPMRKRSSMRLRLVVANMNNGAKKGGKPRSLADHSDPHQASRICGNCISQSREGKKTTPLTPSSPTSTRPARAST